MRALHDSVRASGKAASYASTSRHCASQRQGRILCERFTIVCEPAARPHLMRALHDSVPARNLFNNKKKAYKKEKLVGYIELVNIAHKLFMCLNIRITKNFVS